MNEVTNETTGGEKKGGNMLPIIVVIVIVLALAAGGYYLVNNNKAEEAPATTDDATALLGLEGEGPVARVDGVEIGRDEYRRSAEQIISSYAAQGVDVSGADQIAAIKDQALASLINRQLVFAAAEKAGVTADDTAVEAEYQNVLSSLGGEEGVATALTAAGLDEQDLRDDLKKSVIINSYLSSKLNLDAITVSDEEVASYYETAKAGATVEVPALEEVSELIKTQLLAEKQQQAIGTELDGLRANANIEVLI